MVASAAGAGCFRGRSRVSARIDDGGGGGGERGAGGDEETSSAAAADEELERWTETELEVALGLGGQVGAAKNRDRL